MPGNRLCCCNSDRIFSDGYNPLDMVTWEVTHGDSIKDQLRKPKSRNPHLPAVIEAIKMAMKSEKSREIQRRLAEIGIEVNHMTL